MFSSASTADASKMMVIGQTKGCVAITVLHDKPIVWNLGKCVIIKNLSVQVLIGEPGKLDNGIVTLPHIKNIQTADINGDLVYLDYSNIEEKRRHICKVPYL